MVFADDVIPDLAAYLRDGKRAALATLVHVDGSSPRPTGSQIAVDETGRSAGMITGGCAEQAIIAEARACIDAGVNKTVRYGAGSAYLDIVLPCGSGIDVHFETRRCAQIAQTVASAHAERRSVDIAIDIEPPHAARGAAGVSPTRRTFVKTHAPPFRLYVFGEGPNLLAFSRIATAAGYAVVAHSPSQETLALLRADGVEAAAIHNATDFAGLPLDAYSAVVTLFHEHEWENAILRAALNADVAYIGALGSRKTHAARLDALAAGAPTNRDPALIRGPVGLDIGAASPVEIAVSILAEIIATRRNGAP